MDHQENTRLAAPGAEGLNKFRAGDLVGGAYEILASIGSGGMGQVYRVRHTVMDREYALKALTAEHVSEKAWRRFQNEAQAIARMNHPNVVGIYNLGLHDGHQPFYVMDLLRGSSLLERIRKSGPLHLYEALVIFRDVGTGIAYAHKMGIVHFASYSKSTKAHLQERLTVAMLQCPWVDAFVVFWSPSVINR